LTRSLAAAFCDSRRQAFRRLRRQKSHGHRSQRSRRRRRSRRTSSRSPLIAISERGLDAAGDMIAFLVGGPTPGQFSVRRTNDFDVSDAVLLPSGELLVLERKFSWLTGVGIRIRRIALKSVAPGAVVDGPSIFDADPGHEIDNMEGIDAHVTSEGDTVLTLVSDDNFSMIQRTLLLQFRLVD
jgi:hypothetical protein